MPHELGWLRDRAAACRMRLQRGKGNARQVAEDTLDPRSAYILAGAARFVWQHSIRATKALRYSISFRTLKASARRRRRETVILDLLRSCGSLMR